MADLLFVEPEMMVKNLLLSGHHGDGIGESALNPI